MSLVAHTIIPPSAIGSQSEIIAGRVLASSWADGEQELLLTNVHNFGFATADRGLVHGSIRTLHTRVSAAPESRLLFVAGDFNGHASGEVGANLLKAGRSSSSGASSTPSRAIRAWSDTLQGLTKLAQPAWTRFGGDSNPVLSRIDRIYVTAPPLRPREIVDSETRPRFQN
jgi:hypothetical protein